MNTRTFQHFQSLIYDTSGIHLTSDKAGLVLARIGKRMRNLGLKSPESYLEQLKNDAGGAELVQLIDAISTNVTSFFREPAHFQFLESTVADWHARGQRRFRIWCAASSTGEEPYSIAMSLSDALPPEDCDCRILATDISTRVLHHAIEGNYGADRVAGIPAYRLHRHFDRNKNSALQYGISPSIREMVLFKRLNLSRHPFPLKGPLDMVFCRNVMIYFDAALRTQLIGEIHRLLKPGGYLLVGHAESLNGLKHEFQPVRPAVYQKGAN